MTNKNLKMFNALLIQELKRKDLEIESLKMQISESKTKSGRARCKDLNKIIKLKKSLSLKNADFQRVLDSLK